MRIALAAVTALVLTGCQRAENVTCPLSMHASPLEVRLTGTPLPPPYTITAQTLDPPSANSVTCPLEGPCASPPLTIFVFITSKATIRFTTPRGQTETEVTPTWRVQSRNDCWPGGSGTVTVAWPTP
ncbi:MAG: hypothetical protein MUF00_17290 [Gemmatimonadaceae bacterium]|jgi:hypothetical protein|nr:hypothetical protein [Gemmatimonadaceae bacterium]